MTLSKAVVLKAVLLGTMAVPMLTSPALGQQEVDPTWYNPWPTQAKVAAQPVAAKSTLAHKPSPVKVASTTRPKTNKVAQIRSARKIERTQAMAASPAF